MSIYLLLCQSAFLPVCMSATSLSYTPVLLFVYLSAFLCPSLFVFPLINLSVNCYLHSISSYLSIFFLTCLHIHLSMHLSTFCILIYKSLSPYLYISPYLSTHVSIFCSLIYEYKSLSPCVYLHLSTYQPSSSPVYVYRLSDGGHHSILCVLIYIPLMFLRIFASSRLPSFLSSCLFTVCLPEVTATPHTLDGGSHFPAKQHNAPSRCPRGR